MRVLLDFHHHALAESYQLLFEDRFGWECWFPYGMGWFDADVWQFEKQWHGDAVARQYLDGIWAGLPLHDDGTVIRSDPRHPGRLQRGITYEAAQASRWDLVISSLPHNDAGYHGFAKEHDAAFGVQVGNNHQESRWDLASFVLASSTLPGFGPEYAGRRFAYHGAPAVMYHQEFSLDVFRAAPPPEASRTVASFVNCFPETPTYPRFTHFANAHADEFDFRVYGAYGSAPDDDLKAGDISLVPAIADAMRETRIAWHDKWWGDGFGHVIHDWFAIGRPVVGSFRYYSTGISAPLWQEGVTTWDIERPEHEVLDVMRRLRDDDDFYWTACERAAKRFREIVDFDADAEAVRSLIESIL